MPAITERLSHFDTYFFVDMAVPALTEHAALLEGAAKAVLGAKWQKEVEERRKRYRAAVEDLLREQAETRGARSALDAELEKVVPWRRAMEASARLATGSLQERLLRAAGFGLGSPRSVKDQKDFWLAVSASIDVERAQFEALGVPKALLAVPKTRLEALEATSQRLAQERAEDAGRFADLKEARAGVDEVFRVADLALTAAKATAELLDDRAALSRALSLDAALAAALSEAKVRTHKRVEEGDAPAALLGGQTADDASLDDVTPGSVTPGNVTPGNVTPEPVDG